MPFGRFAGLGRRHVGGRREFHADAGTSTYPPVPAGGASHSSRARLPAGGRAGRTCSLLAARGGACR